MIEKRLIEAYEIADKMQREALQSELEREVYAKHLPEEGEREFNTVQVRLALKKVSAKILRTKIVEREKACRL